jgi:Flp pilus assembly protein TadB
MIIKFDTEKIPDRDYMFLAELILIAGKDGITIDKAIQNCRDTLKVNGSQQL